MLLLPGKKSQSETDHSCKAVLRIDCDTRIALQAIRQERKRKLISSKKTENISRKTKVTIFKNHHSREHFEDC